MAHNGANYYCENDIIEFTNIIERAIYNINKNLGQMDFDNANAREEANEIADNMIRYCNTLKDEINNYTFE